MKITSILFYSILLISLFSCKKDATFEFEMTPTDGAANFYVSGHNYYDDFNHYFFDWRGGELVDSSLLEFGGTLPSFGSASSLGVENGKKYIVSMVGSNPSTFRNRVIDENDGSGGAMGLLGMGVYLQVRTDDPAEAEPVAFTEEQLLDIFEVGKLLRIGDLPGQVEIGFKDAQLTEEILDSMAWGFPAMRGSTRGFENMHDITDSFNAENMVEVLEVEAYEDPTRNQNARGLMVNVRFSANLYNHLSSLQNLSLRGVNATFFFEYE